MVSLATTLIFALSRLLGATTVNANSPSQSDVAAAIGSGRDGDIVTIPGGTASWTRAVRVKKGITLQGAGVGKTIIKDAVQSGPLLDCSLATGNLTRITGIEFQDGGRSGKELGGILKVTGSNTNGSQFRMDHCQFGDLNGMHVFNTVVGVIDHNTFAAGAKAGDTIEVYGHNWNNGTLGDGSYAADSNFGTDKFLFIEDNVFHFSGGTGGKGITDSYGGGRFVVRYNQIFDDMTVETHGTESNQRARGVRAVEVYNNTFTGTDKNRFIGKMRSGVILLHDNTITGYWKGSTEFTLQNYRCQDMFAPWDQADGQSQWDVNQPGGPFYSGAVTASGSQTVTVTGTSWTTDQWKGYTIRRDNPSGSPAFAEITSNTANTISYLFGVFGTLSFQVGDTFKLYKVNQALDQPGRVKGSLIRGNPPVKPGGWNDQVTEACYAWNNTSGGASMVGFVRGNLVIRPGEHYFNNTPMPGYTPYIYPHPLVNGVRPPEQMTRNAKGNSQHNLRGKRQPWGGKKQDRRQGKKPNENPTNEMAEGQENPGN